MHLQCIAPTLIVLCLALGVAENPPRTKLTTMAFVKSSEKTQTETDIRRSGSATVNVSGLGASKTEQGNSSELSISGGGSLKESA